MGAEQIVQKLARPALELLFNAAPVIIGVSRKCYQFYKALPIVYVQLIIGAVLCFFGGLYPALFAALQVSYCKVYPYRAYRQITRRSPS